MHRFIFISLAALWVFMVSDSILYAGSIQNTLSFQGYSGLLNIPNAEVMPDGRFAVGFTNQLEYNRRFQDRADNYLFSMGILPFLEINGRLTEDHPDGMRDISAGAKLKIPFLENIPYVPDAAVGIQDIAGGSTYFQTKYAVLSEEIWRFRLTFGYGSGPDRLEGFFGGAEFKVMDWCYLLAENDTEETHVGVRLKTPDNLLNLNLPFDLGLTVKTSLDHEPGNFDFGFTLSFPLDFSRKRRKASDDEAVKKRMNLLHRQEPTLQNTDRDKSISEIKEKLAELGFENLEAGIKDNSALYIAYENNTYNHNELDALGLVLGAAGILSPPELTIVTVAIKEMNIPMLELSVPLPACRSFLSSADTLSEQTFSDQLQISRRITDRKQIRFVEGSENSSRRRTHLKIYPGLKTFIGTEAGVFDGLLSVKPEFQHILWNGGMMAARFDIPVIWSEDFDKDQIFSDHKEDAHLEQFLFHQAFKANSDIMTMFSGGVVLKDQYGIWNETIWTPGSGNHRFRLNLGFFEDENREGNDIIIGSYRYYFDKADLFLEAAYGKYWYQDTGWTFEMKRFFGDTAVSLFYQHTGSDTGERAVGIGFSLPLTPRKDMNPSYLQVKGSEQWTYRNWTTVAESGEKNPTNTTIAVKPELSHNLERSYYNRDRLSEDYIRKHLLRLREAYWKMMPVSRMPEN